MNVFFFKILEVILNFMFLGCKPVIRTASQLLSSKTSAERWKNLRGIGLSAPAIDPFCGMWDLEYLRSSSFIDELQYDRLAKERERFEEFHRSQNYNEALLIWMKMYQNIINVKSTFHFHFLFFLSFFFFFSKLVSSVILIPREISKKKKSLQEIW
jgi:hypothetical protein